MANHSLPTLTSTYTNFVSELDGRLDDLAVGMDPAVTVVTNPPTNSIRWNSTNKKWEKWSGTAWNELSANYAINLQGPSTVTANSAGDALRITQIGSGNALVVEDSANPDSTPFVIDAAGRVGIGTTSVDIYASASLQLKGNTSELQIQSTNNAASSPVAAFSIVRYSAREGGIYLKDENATEVAFVGLPYRGGSPSQDLTFRTTGGEARFSQDGNFCLGGATVAGTSFRNVKDIAGATTAQAYMANGVIRGDVTGAVQVYRSSPTVQDTGFTLSDLTHFSAFPGTKGANATVTNQYGFTATSALTAATNNYGFYSAISAATGRWNFYAAGTAANYFAGETTINSGLTIGRAAVTSPVASDGNVFSGTYTPTVFNTTNVSSSTSYSTHYMRVGNTVTVAGHISITATNATTTTLAVTIPVPSAFATTRNCAGTLASSTAGLSNAGVVYADATNDVAVFRIFAENTNSNNYMFHFTYQVI